MASFPLRKVCRAWILISCFPAFTYSQQPVFRLDQLIDSAQIHFPLLNQKKALFNGASAAVTDTRHQFLPALRVMDEVNAGTDNSMAGSYFAMNIIPSTSSGVNAGNNTNPVAGNIAILAGQYDLADFGYRRARIATAEAYAQLGLADYRQTVYQLKNRLSNLYISLLKAGAHLALDRQNISRYENIYRVIHALTQSGLKPGSDSSLAIAELSKSKISYTQSQGIMDQLRDELSYLTGIDQQKIIIDTSMERFIRFAPGNLKLTGDSMGNPLLEFYYRIGELSKREEYLAAKSFQPKIILAASTWARGSSIFYSNQYKPLYEGLSYQRYNYLAGIVFQYDLFSSLHRHDRLRISQFQREAAEDDYMLQQLNLQHAGAQADLAIHTAETNLEELPHQLNAARDTYNQKIAQYRAGIIDLVDLTNSAFVLYRSTNDYVETLGDWLRAQLAKAYATGFIDSFIQRIK